MSNDWIYDVETYPNVFTLALEHADAPLCFCFEISDRRNDSRDICDFLDLVRSNSGRLVGFNNIGFDYPILHTLMLMRQCDAKTLYDKAQAIIDSQDDSRFAHLVSPNDRLLPQIDLYKIHHFDNKARATGLKVLEFNMRSNNIADLPFKVGTNLTAEQIIMLKQYNQHDVQETKKFMGFTTDMLNFRENLCKMYPGRDWLNYNDTKIGKEYFIMQLEKSGIECFEFMNGYRVPRQTKRPVIHLKDAVLPWIEFKSPEFNRILNWFKEQSITETKGVFNDITATVNGFEFVFGLGGIHGSLENKVIESDHTSVVLDLDVASYYPNLAIRNGFYPAHLGKEFCDIYESLFEQRKQYPKKSAESAMLKLALNGVYGDSNNQFSPFYDPLYTMTITLNGQLLLCLLAEQLMQFGQIIQINTDGLTIKCAKDKLPEIEEAYHQWEKTTGLTLESASYKMMAIRDVNNYVAVYENGQVKRKGAYEYDLDWHQNASALVVPMVAEKVLVEGVPIRETVENWPEIMDFMLRTKVPRSSYLAWGDQQSQNISRYYIAKDGKPLKKWMPPLKGKHEWRCIGIEAGWNVQVCNNIEDAVLPVDFEYYIREVEKLCLGLA